MSNSRTSNSIKNIGASVGYRILSLVLSFISRTVFIQVLGVGFLGITGLFNDVLSMLNLAELGFGTAMTYSMYKPLAENDYNTLAGLTQFYKKVYGIIACAIAGIGICLIPFLPYLVNLENEIDHLILYYLLFVASNVASYLVVAKTTVLYADQKNYILIKYTAYWKTVETITLIVVLLSTHSYVLYLIIQVLFVYGCNFHQSYIAQKRYPFINKKVKLPKEITNHIFKDVGSAFLYKIATVLITATDNTLISILISTEMVGYYSNYAMISSKLIAIIGTVFYSLIASLGNLIAKESSEKRYSVFSTMQTFSAILCTFCATCLLLLEQDFIRIWLGEEYLLSPFTVLAVVLNFYFSLILSPVSSFREAAGLFRKTKFIMLWAAFLNIGLSIFLGRRIGVAGILLATSISKILTLFWYEPKILYSEFFKKPCRLYFIGHLKILSIVLVSVLFARFTAFWLHPETFFGLVIKGIIIALSSMLVIFVFYRGSDGARLMEDKFKSILENIPFFKKRV